MCFHLQKKKGKKVIQMKNNKMGAIELFVPGRLCLFGEHSDWAGLQRTVNSNIEPGHAIVTGTEEGIYATVTKSDVFCVHSEIEGNEFSFECEMNVEKLKKIASEGDFFSYVAGVASYVCEWYQTGGIDVDITRMTLPMKSGLSSSAAICVLVARAYNELYHLKLSTKGTMNIAYWGELRTKSRCGRLDQACAFGNVPISMVFDSNEIDVSRISIGGELYYVFADLKASKDTIKILTDLNKCYPFPETELDYKVHEAFGVDNERIVKKAIEYIESGDAKSLGKLMIEAQNNFDTKVAPASYEQLKAPVLHSVLNDPELQQFIYGGKGVGSQGDGTVQFLAKDEENQQKLMNYLENVRGMKAYKLTLKPNAVIRKAIIPVAGYGTRMYPFTRGMRKEFLPVIDKEGLVKPAILVLLEELVNAGIEQICLVIGQEDKEFYDRFFFKELSQEHYNKMSETMKQFEKRIKDVSKRIQFRYQREQKGFGHAVYQCKDFTQGEPVLLLLGDTIYESDIMSSCTKQLLDAYKIYGGDMISLQNIPLIDSCYYGVFSGVWESQKFGVMNVMKIKEKPSTDFAKENLTMMSYGKEKLYGAFGQYILTKNVFQRLEEMIRDNLTSNGEIQLTDALEYVKNQSGLYGFVPKGKSYDLGNPKSYREAVYHFNNTDI